MRLADLPDDADEIEVHLEKTQGDRILTVGLTLYIMLYSSICQYVARY